MSEIFLLLDRGYCATLALRIVPPATFRVPWAFFFPIRLLKSDWFRHIRILIAVPLLKISGIASVKVPSRNKKWE
jgi:hypothetical protein